MDNSLLKLKLDTVYRDLSIEEAQKKFDELRAPPPAEENEAAQPAGPLPVKTVHKAKPHRKVVKALVPKNK